MSRQRLIVQMGMGVGDTAGQAAERAVADAQGRARIHVDVPFAVHLTLGVPQTAEIEPGDLAAAFATSDLQVRIVPGGMLIPQPDGTPLVLVSAAIERFPIGAPKTA